MAASSSSFNMNVQQRNDEIGIRRIDLLYTLPSTTSYLFCKNIIYTNNLGRQTDRCDDPRRKATILAQRRHVRSELMAFGRRQQSARCLSVQVLVCDAALVRADGLAFFELGEDGVARAGFGAEQDVVAVWVVRCQ